MDSKPPISRAKMISITKSAIKAMKVRTGLLFLLMPPSIIVGVVSAFPKHQPDYYFFNVAVDESNLTGLFYFFLSALQACGPDCGEIYQKSKSGLSLIAYLCVEITSNLLYKSNSDLIPSSSVSLSTRLRVCTWWIPLSGSPDISLEQTRTCLVHDSPKTSQKPSRISAFAQWKTG